MGFFEKLWTDSESDRRETVQLQAEVSAGTTSWTTVATHTVDADATVEKVTAWHTPASEDALKTRPRKVAQKRRTDLPEYNDDGEEFVTGEPTDRPYLTNTSVDEGDQIVVEAVNENADYDYRFTYLVTLDYAGGTSRFLGGGA